MNTEGQYLTFKSPGYFDETRYVLPKLGERTNLQVSFIKLPTPKTLEATVGGQILIGKVSVDVSPNIFVTGDGSKYEGEVTYYGHAVQNALYVSLTRNLESAYIKDAKQQFSAMTVLGGLQVIWLGDAGQILSIEDGTSLALSIALQPIVENVTYPDVIHVLKYELLSQSYVPSTTALREGDIWSTTIGSVDHLLWGIPTPTRAGTVKIEDELGASIEDAIVMLFTDQENPVSIGFTNGEGLAKMMIPLQKSFTLRTSYLCVPDPMVYKDYEGIPTFGPEPLVLEPFKMPDDYFYEAVGRLVDCTGVPIHNGAVQIQEQIADRFVLSDENGEFRLSLLQCKEKYQLIATNGSEGTSTEINDVSQPVIPGQIQLGDIIICN